LQKALSISSEGAGRRIRRRRRRKRRKRAGIENPENDAERGMEVDASHAEGVDAVPF
jgi:hypothetical protein